MECVPFWKARKLWLGVLFISLVLPPLVLWRISESHWRWSEEVEKDEPGDLHDQFENLDEQLTTIKCPAKAGQELRDYWRCLWSTSITAEGLEQHRKILWDNYVASVDSEMEAMDRWRRNKTLRKRRVRRQVSNADNFTYHKVTSILLDTFTATRPATSKLLKACQQDILPAVSIQKFLLCLRKVSLGPPFNSLTLLGRPFGESFLPTYQPTTFPPNLGKIEYDDLEFPLVIHDSQGHRFSLQYDFKPLEREERLSNFLGADPYFDDNFSPYRYRYNSLNTRQRQPGWSYGGLDNSRRWHELDIARFAVPLKLTVSFSSALEEFISDFAQTYPGIGELAEGLGNLDTPLDYRWTKDSGYNVYTRYVIPLLEDSDLAYYKKKGLIDESVNVKPDAEDLQAIIGALERFKNESAEPIVFVKAGGNVDLNPNFNKSEDVPFHKAYFNSVQHFYGVDFSAYRAIKAKLQAGKNPDNVLAELEVVRNMLRAYVRAVVVQEKCVQEMVREHEERLEDPDDIQKVIDQAIAASGRCKTAPTFDDAINTMDADDYRVTYDNLRFLYNAYHDRKEARARYSLPNFPVPFPICNGNDPSPIDINTGQGRKSSIKNYEFGDAAFQLHRFFMFFPLDGSPLLTVGIVNGQRLDESSVALSGGAVRGQNLTFQYMHIHFSDSWQEVGSEHWIDGKGAQMELQMVFTISGSADAIKYWHVLLRVQNQLFQFREKLVIVLSVLVDVVETDADLKKKIKDENLGQDPYLFEALAQAAYHFRKIPEIYPDFEQPRGYVSLDPVFRFIDFIPKKSSNFYTYRGSLSWPPCFGYVIWSVYEQRLYMSKRQFDQFANIPAFGVQDSNFAHNNFRKFEDIWVEEEHEPGLSHANVESLKRQRTVDRHILVGYHDVADDTHASEAHGVVGEEIYFLGESRASITAFSSEFTAILSVMIYVISCV